MQTLNINQLIQKRRLSTKRVAKILKVEHQLIVDVALGYRTPNKELTFELAELLRVPSFKINPEYVHPSDFTAFKEYLEEELLKLNYKDKEFSKIVSRIHAIEVKQAIENNRHIYADIYEQSVPNQQIPVY